VPLMAPRYVCAVAESARENSTSTIEKNRSIIFIHLTSEFWDTRLPDCFAAVFAIPDGDCLDAVTASGNLGYLDRRTAAHSY